MVRWGLEEEGGRWLVKVDGRMGWNEGGRWVGRLEGWIGREGRVGGMGGEG